MSDLRKLKVLLEAIELMEYKREITASRMAKNILQGLEKDGIFASSVKELPNDGKIDAVLEKLESIDPTKNKQFVQWLAKNYGLFRIEDSGRVNDTLTKFVKLKTQISRQGKSVDINQYDWHSLEAMIDDVTNVDVGQKNEPSNLQYKNMDDITVLYSGAYGKLLVPNTKEASCEIGSGTKWCTAAQKDNRYNYYTKKQYPNSKLYIWIDKNGDKYQFHFESEQFMDSLDTDLPDEKMKYFVNEHPVLKKFFEKMAPKYPLVAIKYMDNPSEELQLAAVQQYWGAISHIQNPSEEVQLVAVQQDGYAIGHIQNPSEEVQLAAVQHYWGAISHIQNPTEKVKQLHKELWG